MLSAGGSAGVTSTRRTSVLAIAILCILLVAQHTCSEFYDVLQPHLVPPDGGCKLWADVPEQDQYWRAQRPPRGASNSCAQQGRGNPGADWDAGMGGGAQAHYISSYCISKRSGKPAACSSGWGVPEQINVQIASGTAVVPWGRLEAGAPPNRRRGGRENRTHPGTM